MIGLRTKWFIFWMLAVCLCWAIEFLFQFKSGISGFGIIAAILLAVCLLLDYNDIIAFETARRKRNETH